MSKRSTAPPERPRPKPLADDLPGDLPPIDGGVGEDEDTDTDASLDDEPEVRDDNGDPLDDTTGEGDALPELTDTGEEEGSALDAGNADDLDVGPGEFIDDDESALAGGDDEGPDEDYGLAENEPASMIDAGEEGPSAVEESLEDETLPALGTEEEEAPDDDLAVFDGDLDAGRQDESASRWESFGRPLILPAVRALVRSGAGVLAVGGEIARIDLETGVERLPASGLHGGDATGVAVLAGDLFVTTEEGGLFASQDGGTTFSEAGGWRAQLRPEDAAAGVDIVGSKVDGLWGKTAQGVLLHSLDGERWKKVDVGGFVRAVGLDEAGRAVVLVRTLGAHELLRRQGDAWARAAIPTDTVPPGLVGAATVAARAKVLAVAIEGQGVFRSLDGVAWSPIPGTEAVTAMAVLDATGAVVVGLTGAEADVQASLVRIGPDGEPATVATWEDRAEGEPGVAAIVVDDAHEVVWVGGGFGLAVFQPRMPGSTRAIPV